MSSRRDADGPSAMEWLAKYADDAARQAKPSVVSADLLRVQARRATLIKQRLVAGEPLVLPDPVGTGKTAVALIAAAMLLEAKSVRRVVVVAPNEVVRQQWRHRATWVRSPRTGKPPAGHPFHVLTRKQLAVEKRPVKPEGVLVVIDEAHRGLQAEGDFHREIEAWAKGCHVLLVTATPFQLSSQGLLTMLAVGRTGDDRGKTAVESYGAAVAGLARQYRAAVKRSAPAPARDPVVLAALQSAIQRRPAAVSVLNRRILPPDAGLLRLRGEPAELCRDTVKVSADWQEAYHVARVVPELVDTGKGDMFNRRLLSCSEAFWHGTAGHALQEKAKESPRVVTLVQQMERRLGHGCGHPKVNATADWVVQRLREGRHVLVFCVFLDTQQVLAKAIASKLGKRGAEAVKAPTGAALPSTVVDRFRNPQGPSLALVVTDRFSESIDLDGGRPCLVHHDLPWTPARVTQRWGRVVRAGSQFTPVKQQDIYVPVVDVDADRRLFDTVKARAALGDLLLPREVLTDTQDTDEYTLHDDLLDQLRPPNLANYTPG